MIDKAMSNEKKRKETDEDLVSLKVNEIVSYTNIVQSAARKSITQGHLIAKSSSSAENSPVRRPVNIP